MIDDEYLQTAIDASKKSEAILLENFESDFEVEYKSSADLVSEIDLECDRVIKEHIRDEYPDHAFFTEESGTDGTASHRWIVDPLDGTHNYVNGFTHYCVTIALEIDDEIHAGVVNLPATGEVYAAVRDTGAYRDGEPISVSETSSLEDAFLGMGISPPASTDPEFLDLFERLVGNPIRTEGVRRLGSGAVDLSLVADGKLDGVFDMYTSPWDVAAGALIVEEAGGTVTDFEDKSLDFGVGEQELNIVATNGEIHEALLEQYRHVAGTASAVME